jgi:hypothetical protein
VSVIILIAFIIIIVEAVPEFLITEISANAKIPGTKLWQRLLIADAEGGSAVIRVHAGPAV